MKKLLAGGLFLVLLLLAFPGRAQVFFGFKAGATIATIDERPTLASIGQAENITGAAAGFFLQFGGEGLFSLRPEFNYQQKGYRYRYAEADSSYSERYNYLDVPVALRLNLGTRNFKIFAEGGASMGFLLNGVRTIAANGIEAETDIDPDNYAGAFGEQHRDYDLGGLVGGGIEAKVGIGRVFINGRYNLDLNDFYTFEQDTPPDWEAIRWRSFDLTIGYGIRL